MRLSFLLLLLLGVQFLSAQDELTVADLSRQSAFIEAKREALLGKVDEAIEQFETLAEKDAGDDAVQFELGRLYKAKEDLDAAIDAVRKAYDARPNEVYATFLADLYQETGRHREGAALYAQLRRRNPGSTGLYLEEAASLVRAQDVKGAIAVYNELEGRIGINEETTRLKHALYLGSGDTKRAEKELVQLVEARPKNLDYRHLLAGFYTSQGETKAAERVYREILSREPADVRAQLALQQVGAPTPTRGGNDDAQLMSLLGRSDVDIDLKIGKVLPLIQQIARADADAATSARALRLAEELRRVHPDEAKAAALLGDIHFHTGDYDRAADAYQTTLDLDDKVFPVWEQLLGTLYLSNRIAELRKYAEEALDLYPNRPSVYVNYALGEALRANFGEANSLLGEARLMVNAQPDAAAGLQRISEALTTLEAGGTLPPEKATELPGGKDGPLGLLLRDNVDLASVSGLDSPGNTNAVLLERVGDALLAAGDNTGAAKAYGRAKQAGSKSKALPAKLAKAGSR